jgi:hypothetical protein
MPSSPSPPTKPAVLLVQTSAVRLRIRRENSRWLFDTIINNARASKTAIDLIIGRLNALHVKSFAPATPPATLPSVAPTLRITIEGNNRRETLLLGEPVPVAAPPNAQPSADAAASVEYYAQLEGRAAVFTVAIPNDLTAALRTAQVSLREKRLLEFDPRAVTAVTLNAPNQPRSPSNASTPAPPPPTPPGRSSAAATPPPARKRSPPTAPPSNASSNNSPCSPPKIPPAS